MPKLKLILLSSVITTLFSCTTPEPTSQPQIGYLKNNITQTELNNRADSKRYSYYCKNLEDGSTSYLASYFPLSRESRKQENFGIYFQLDGGKAEPFDHIENKSLNVRGTKFEVIYRSYYPINGNYVHLIAREYRSIYYKDQNGVRTPWLECRES